MPHTKKRRISRKGGGDNGPEMHSYVCQQELAVCRRELRNCRTLLRNHRNELQVTRNNLAHANAAATRANNNSTVLQQQINTLQGQIDKLIQMITDQRRVLRVRIERAQAQSRTLMTQLKEALEEIKRLQNTQDTTTDTSQAADRGLQELARRRSRTAAQKGGSHDGPEMQARFSDRERRACLDQLDRTRARLIRADNRIAALRADARADLARASEALAQRNECRRQLDRAIHKNRELLQQNDTSLKMLLETAKKMEQLRDANVLILRTLDKYAAACGECGRRAAAACCAGGGGGGGGGGDDASTGGGRHTKKRRTRGRRKRRRRTRRRRKRRQRRTRRGGELFGFRKWVKKKTGYTARKEAQREKKRREEETERVLARLEGDANNRGVINNR